MPQILANMDTAALVALGFLGAVLTLTFVIFGWLLLRMGRKRGAK